MSNKITTTSLVHRLELKGHSIKESEKFIENIMLTIAEELCKGNSVALDGIGILTSVKQDPATKLVIGKPVEVGERLSVNFRTSKKLQKSFTEGFSKEANTQKSLKEFGANFKTLFAK